jgi:tetratricopeptide (TPR) repeat protein
MRQLQQATEAYEDIRKVSLTPDHTEKSTGQSVLTFPFGSLRQHDEAIEMCESIVKRNQKRLGPNDPHTLSSQHNLAVIYDKLGRYEEAVEILQDVLARRKKRLGDEHPDTAASQESLASVYRNLRRHQDADQVQRGHEILGKKWWPFKMLICQMMRANTTVTNIEGPSARVFRWRRRYDRMI